MNRYVILMFFMSLWQQGSAHIFELVQLVNQTNESLSIVPQMRPLIHNDYGSVLDRTLSLLLSEENYLTLNPGQALTSYVVPCSVQETGLCFEVFLCLSDAETVYRYHLPQLHEGAAYSDAGASVAVPRRSWYGAFDDSGEDLSASDERVPLSVDFQASCNSDHIALHPQTINVGEIAGGEDALPRSLSHDQVRELAREFVQLELSDDAIASWANRFSFLIISEHSKVKHQILYSKTSPISYADDPGVYVKTVLDGVDYFHECSECHTYSCSDLIDVKYHRSMVGGRMLITSERSFVCCCRSVINFHMTEQPPLCYWRNDTPTCSCCVCGCCYDRRKVCSKGLDYRTYECTQLGAPCAVCSGFGVAVCCLCLIKCLT